MKALLIVLITTLAHFVGFTQVTIEKQVISVIDNTNATLGEAIMWTFEGSEISIHQGFHPNEIGAQSTPVVDLNNLDLEVTIYPNPTTDYLHISLSQKLAGLSSYSIHDAEGRLLTLGRLSSVNSRCDMTELPPGRYGLLIHHENVSAFISWIIKLD